MLGLCEGVFWKGDLWVLEDKNGIGSVFDWIMVFSVLCLYSLCLSLLSLICFRFFLFFFLFFFFLLTFCLNLSGRDKEMFARHTISCPATLLFFQCKFVFLIISFPLISICFKKSSTHHSI
jgi:hypothetical protein